MNKQRRERVTYVLGGPFPYVPGSVRAQCSKCGAAIYLSPSIFDEPGRRICGRCVPIPATAVLTEAVLRDLALEWRCTPDEAYARCDGLMRRLGKAVRRR